MSPAEVFAFFQDVPAVARCMPGAELTEAKGDGLYAGRVKVRLGPFGADFEGEAKVSADPEARLHRLSDHLDAFPPGLVATAPRAARDGHLGLALLHLLVGIACVAALLALWERSLRRAEEVPDATTGRSSSSEEGALVPRLLRAVVPGGRVGALVGKDLRYLSREPRRSAFAI